MFAGCPSWAIAGRAAPGGHEGLLADVLGHAAIADDAEGERERRRGVTVIELGEGLAVAAGDAAQQSRVCAHVIHAGPGAGGRLARIGLRCVGRAHRASGERPARGEG